MRLGIYQEVSRVRIDHDDDRPRSFRSARWNRRSIVDDQQIVVLGGLIQDSFTDGTEKLPYAGDIPCLGSLFRYDTRHADQDQPDDAS